MFRKRVADHIDKTNNETHTIKIFCFPFLMKQIFQCTPNHYFSPEYLLPLYISCTEGILEVSLPR